MHFLRDRDERDYVKMLETFIRDHTDGDRRLHGILSDRSSSASYDCLSCLTWSRVWREATKYETNYRVSIDQAYFVGWRNREFFMIIREERAKSYAKLPSK